MTGTLLPAVLAASLFGLPAAAQEVVSPPDRDVTAPGMMPGNVPSGPMIRVPVPPPPPDPPRWRRYFLPETTDAATFRVEGRLVIHVAGVEPPSADDACNLADGTTWPCGRTALFSLRRFLHGRAVECFMVPPGDVTEVTAPCRVGPTDIASWLVAAGWARTAGFPSDDDVAAQKEAQCTGLGIWRGESKPADCPEASADQGPE